MKLLLELEKPMGGYWDGGAKRRFEFEIESRGKFARIGCWAANMWFDVEAKENATEKQILSNAKRKFKNKLSRLGFGYTWTYIE